jgi:nucleotide-binding universal stress UspA family protein
MSQPIILVPLDGSNRSHAALPVARVFSAIIGASLRIVHVSRHIFPEPMALASRLGLGPDMLQGSSLDARVGEPAAEILAAAKEMSARLIVMCAHTASQRPPAILGATTLSVLRDTSCPVVLVSPEHKLGDWRLRRVLLPHDGTPATSGAAIPALQLVEQAGVELFLILVAGGMTRATRGALMTPRYLDQPQHEWPAWVHEFMERLACHWPGADLRMHVHLRFGNPGLEIVRMASEETIDLIVLTWKREWIDSRKNVLINVIRDAPGPTMVARG